MPATLSTQCPARDYPAERGQQDPTADQEPASTTMFEPPPRRAIKPDIIPEPELATSEQVCKPAAPSIAKGALVKYKGMEVSPAHPPTTKSESESVLALTDCCFLESCLL